MERKEFVYSVEEIFGAVLDELPKDGGEHGKSHGKYYIGPYQRGYKWSSQNEYDQVPQLLKDVHKAWQASSGADGGARGAEDGEYYLQYVTVLKMKDEAAYEVIDGQQRLTTLAIVFDRLHKCWADRHGGESGYEPIPSIGQGRIEYSRDGDEPTSEGNALFDKIARFDTLMEKYRSEGKKAVAMDDSQDLYYITSAVLCIDRFLEQMSDEDVKSYAKFFMHSVKIILNRESDFVTPEEVFVNLNDNKVPLTNTHLIKGLLLTRSVNAFSPLGEAYSYFTVMEQRKVNGRVWDDIQNWVEQPDVSRYFFGQDEHGMEHLLELLMLTYGSGEKGADDLSGGLRLFNRYNEVVQTDEDGQNWMSRLTHCYHKLRSWYEDTDVYNLMGFVLFHKKYKNMLHERLRILLNSADKKKGKQPDGNPKRLLDMSDAEMMRYFAGKAVDILPPLSEGNVGKGEDERNEKTIFYPDERLTPLLLSLSVFPEGFEKRYERHCMGETAKGGELPMLPKFNFPEYDRNNWTYEHVRPQNPKDELKLDDYVKDIVLKMCSDDEQREKIEELISEKKGKISLEEHMPSLYSDLTDEELNSMGNMALLSQSVNSAISNNPYLIKRHMIFKKSREGGFIPSHTMAVFTKAINTKDLSIHLTNWDSEDVKAHAEWMRERNRSILETLKKIEGRQ